MTKQHMPPYLGVAYYPEDWPEEEMDFDIAKMQEAGINAARIAEFAWRKMEPEPGCYQFDWLHRVVDKLGEAGIAVVLGTPTATPPIWLTRMYPDVVMESEAGRRAQHGGRRHCCSNNPHYRAYSAKIVEAMAREFGKDPHVIGWQIDNEIYSFPMGCFCSECRQRFLAYLREKYGDIESLNAAWNLNLFSQAYDRFDDIPSPRDAWHNPHLRMEWIICQNLSHVEFVRMQAEILHRYVDVPVGTDTMPFNGMDYRSMTDALDIVQFNHYNTADNLHGCSLWFDYLRTLKERPFWNTETATNWNGSTDIGQTLKPEGFCRANSWLPIALGGEANMYWLWRTHWAGHELMHGSVLDTCGKPVHVFGEVQEVAEGYRRAADFLRETRVETPVAMHFTSLNWNMVATQSVVHHLDYMDALTQRFYQPIVDSGLRPDVIDARQELDGYRLIFSPLMMTLEEADLPRRMAQWVREGGIWVVGPLTDIRNAVGAKYRHKHFGMLEELTGVEWLYGIPDDAGRIQAQWADGSAFAGAQWYDIYGAEDAMATVTAGHSALVGKAVAVCRPVGKGTVILLGTLPSREDMDRIIAQARELAGIAPTRLCGHIMAAPRRGTTRSGLILVEYAGEPASYTLDHPMEDVLAGGTVQGTLELEPFAVRVLEDPRK